MSIGQIHGIHKAPLEKETGMRIFGNKQQRGGLIGFSISAFLTLATTVVAVCALAAPAQAAAPAFTVRTDFPDTTTTAGKWVKIGVFVENSGTARMSGPVSATVHLPEGLSVAPFGPIGTEIVAAQIQSLGPAATNCETLGRAVTCTIDGTAMSPSSLEAVTVPLSVASDASGNLVVPVEVSGGGVAEPFHVEKSIHVGAPRSFEVEAFASWFRDADSNDNLQAGSSPGTAANSFELPSYAQVNYYPAEFFRPGFTITRESDWHNATPEHERNVIVHTPPGTVASFAATSSRCTATQLNSENGSGLPECPVESQIGVAYVNGNTTAPVFDLVPPPGMPAQFGFTVVGVPVLINASLRPSDSGVDLTVRNTSTSLPLPNVEVQLWGVPADSSHDSSRGNCLAGESGNSTKVEADGICSTDAPRKAFIRLPTSCTGPLQWGIEMDTYEHPGVYHSRTTTTPAQVGCNQLEFTPSVEAKPSTNVGDSPSGLNLRLHLPQNEDPDGLAEAELKDFTLRLPDGLTLNSASADGLGACSPAQIGLESAVGELPARFDGSEPQCPNASKIGAVRVDSPAIDHPLPGTVYLASQIQNPFGSLVALYVVIDDPATGVLIKLPARADLDPKTGQITSVVKDNPQLPFNDFTVELDKGPHAPLRTPVGCGKFTSNTDMTPWTSPEGQDAHPSDSFEIVKGAGGGSCSGSGAQAPFNPTVTAGTQDPTAGAFSPFVLKVSRADGTQELEAIDLNLPMGLLASLRGIPYCSDSALASIPSAPGTGAQEIAHPSCPAASQIGSASVSLGAGPNPLNVNTGKVYWAGPYKGAPLSMVTVFPSVAGPFDLGNVVVRTPFYVDPETAQITAKSDPLPTILDGIPLDIRSVRIDLNRPNYTMNPTSCDPMSFESSIRSATGAKAAGTEHFQVGGCETLPFKPRLSLRLKGKTNRTAHPALRAEVVAGFSNEANIASAVVSLPHSEFLDQSHIRTICTRVQFAEGAGGGERCPKGSVYGFARAVTPLLDQPLEGPVFLRSSSHELPDLVASLGGQIHIDLVGRIDSTKAGGIRTTFESVPDAFVSKFTLMMQGGKKGLLQNSTNLCRGTHRANASFEAHNGKRLEARPELKAHCRKNGAGKHKHGKRHHR